MMSCVLCSFFFFSSRRRHTRCSRDWSSDVCSSDLFGVDFCLLYTSLGLFHINNADAQIRRGVSRAVNLMNAEMFAPYKDRIAPAAVVPVHTAEQEIEEATYALKHRGFQGISASNHVERPIP